MYELIRAFLDTFLDPFKNILDLQNPPRGGRATVSVIALRCASAKPGGGGGGRQAQMPRLAPPPHYGD
jgi:hypothetical protein